MNRSPNDPASAGPGNSRTPLTTPDGRYIVVRGQLWRRANPELTEAERARHVAELMSARRAVRAALMGDGPLKDARDRVQAAKVALGERGPVWWADGAPDYNRRLARNTPYADWFARIEPDTGPSRSDVRAPTSR
ncbi:hypothetical protein [Brevundimonas sp. GCM10030266]|uniref:hypothetical protein n=1 Tax=Brevundimonas sp. GCM10030266 TaxID=3273386 RepID=UPI0036117C7A